MNPQLKSENRKALLLFGGAAIFLFAHLWPWLDFVRITPFGSRDLQRASEWWRLWYPYGPELSGSSHTPGPFLYILLSIPQTLGADWQDITLFRAALYATSGAALFSYFWRKHSPLEAALILLSLASSGLLLQEFTWDWSASFAPPFVGFWLYLVLDHRQKLSRWLAALAVISLGCQIHLNLLILYPVTALLYWRDPPLGAKKNKAVLLAAAALVPYAPFFCWMIAGHALFPHLRPSSFSAIHGGVEALRVKTDPFRFDYLPRVRVAIYELLAYNPIPCFLAFFSLALLPKFKLKRTDENWPITVAFALTGLLAVVMLVAKARYYQSFHLMLAIAPILWAYQASGIRRGGGRPFSPKHLWAAAAASLLVFLIGRDFGTLIALLMVSICLAYTVRGKPSALGHGLLFSLLGVLSLGKNYWEVSRQAEAMAIPQLRLRPPQFPESTPHAFGPIIRKVRQETGWACEELNQKIFAIHMKEFFDLEKFCGSVKISSQKKSADWSGIFLMPKMVGNSAGENSVKAWIMNTDPMLPELKALLAAGKILLAEPIGAGNVWGVPFRLEPNSLVPLEAIRNVGYAYRLTPDDSWMAKVALPRSEGILAGSSEPIFYWDYCPANRFAGCRIFAAVKPAAGRIRVSLSGAPIAVRHPLLQPALAVTWKNFELSYQCDGMWHKSPLISELGSDMFEEYRHPVFVTGPISASVQTHCRGKLAKVKLSIGEIQVRYSNDQRARFKDWQSAELEL